MHGCCIRSGSGISVCVEETREHSLRSSKEYGATYILSCCVHPDQTKKTIQKQIATNVSTSHYHVGRATILVGALFRLVCQLESQIFVSGRTANHVRASRNRRRWRSVVCCDAMLNCLTSLVGCCWTRVP